MKLLGPACIVVAIATTVIHQSITEDTLSVSANTVVEAEFGALLPGALSAAPDKLSPSEPLLSDQEKAALAFLQSDQATSESLFLDNRKAAFDPLQNEQARLEPLPDFPEPMPPKQDLPYLAYYVYAEVLPDKKPADIFLDAVKSIPIATPVEEIKRASNAFGLDFGFMKAVAKIESDFDPKQRTGSYIGLFQLSNYEFQKYGSGDITNSRDNAIAAAYKFASEAMLFESETHKKPTFNDLYLIHQQGWQGAAEHVSHPDRIAWKSICATDEGQEKGEKWCKRAIWRNTLPAIKHIWKSVDNLTSGAFVDMWRQRVDLLYSRYSEAMTEK